MPPNQSSPRSLLLCEWMAGTTISRALGPLPPKKRPKRRVVKVEVSTDDESEEDIIKITYPRTEGASVPEQAPEAVIKKVRFEESQLKSALKKSTAALENSDSDSEADDAPVKKAAAFKKNKKGKKAVADSEDEDESSNSSWTPISDSDSDSEPHPTCKCEDCTRGRAVQKKQAKNKKSKKSKQEKASDSETDTETDTEKSASESETDDEKSAESDQGTKKKGKSAQNKADSAKKKQPNQKGSGNDKKAKQAQQSGGKDQGAKADKKKGKEVPKNVEQSSNKASKRSPSKPPKFAEAKYPAAMPGPHPRRPNLIEPIRAEVVQTERVVESAEDPPPNAFYDPEHRVVRVYYGPVYGNQQNRSLYPRRDPSQRPLPIGIPHPTQNPYYHGFAHGPPPPMAENQYAPAGPWHGPQWPYPHPSGGYVQNGAPPLGQVDPNSGNKGAFDVTAANGPDSHSTKSKGKDIANNVVPEVKSIHDNPYIPKRTRSQFSTFGSRHSGSQRGDQNNAWPQSNRGSDGGNRNDRNKDQGPGNNDWNNSNDQAGQNDTWGNAPNTDTWDAAPNNNTWDTSNDQQTSNQWETPISQPPSVDQNADVGQDGTWNNDNTAPGGTWDNSNEQNNVGWGSSNDNNVYNNNPQDQWQQQQANGSTSGSQTVGNNVCPPMPGAWDSGEGISGWADPSVAVDTKGKADQW